ncbi:DNA polymerase III subunit delta' C-terminal domain-containing protein [Nevskia sp.]|uniref:DNA polymerase III subunit delta' C-terminal domain-containing protein n=1 Tax=Nevskia sp. TaxID=1929292 RepID=UPI0025DE4E39|nr:DNA polymerase III subunit delta' C-terminal domain-containing protein [Nevskia sp.]
MKPLPWQKEVWATIAGSIREQRLSHALLLAGPDGAGKRHFAGCITAALWCRNLASDGSACGECADCLQVASGAHSGYFLVRAEEGKRDISIDQVRALSEKLTMTQYDGRAKVAIIEPADALNVNGVNALLKTIEEPTPGSHLLLVSARPQALAATLRSRCQRVRLAAPGRAIALDWLRNTSGGKHDDATLAAALDHAFGAPLKALQLLDGAGLAQRSDWSRGLVDLAGGRGEPATFAAAINEADPVGWLQWLYGWMSRLLRMRIAASADDDAAIVSLAQRLPAELLDRYIAEVQAMLAKVHGPADKKLLIESLLIGWLALLARAGRAAQNRPS